MYKIDFILKLLTNLTFFQETSFASDKPVTRSLSSVSANKGLKPLGSPAISKIPKPESVGTSASKNGSTNASMLARNNHRNSLNSGRKAKINSSLEEISPWLVTEVGKKEGKEKNNKASRSKIPQLRTVITTEL